ncbi:nitronate monooxygenase [Oscillochloris sp. ZM17-4]|uniref:nitronate monooxygenase n=1 Tax=Oscillochloris sp. ZM17-4 TaxID=2866714 RepID=UPI001C738CD8|nr:nitronate monooxygenase [Oscillochloris sp. ZM17-4]MBX0329735.1 nitronate monooxygenase [Oscillochloris sp. ZM17-4]
MQSVTLPVIIQGGMGAGVSDWRLANAVSRHGQLGVVSGTALDTILVRRLQDGDEGGHMRRAMAQFPLPEVTARILKRHFHEGGRAEGTPYIALPLYKAQLSAEREQLLMLSAFVEVYLAKEGHDGMVGINLLTKIQQPNLATIYGAMLAGVDAVLMGAGIPREFPVAIDALVEHRLATSAFDVEGMPAGETAHVVFDPAAHWQGQPPALRRPMFFPIIASNSLATVMARKAGGRIDGFIIEGPTAGGHNAPPRGQPQLNDRGEPIYGPRDEVDLAKIAELGLPFWLAGGKGSPEGLRQALDAGAAGIQVGTLFAYCEESGFAAHFKSSVLSSASRDAVDVLTDPRASPTGFPFKVVRWDEDTTDWSTRERVCDLGYLRSAYRRPDGTIRYRCASEPINTYVAKGGKVEETEGRKCLCNALMANVGLGQAREDGRVEPPLLTSGDDLKQIGAYLNGRASYSAADVIAYLIDGDAAGEQADCAAVAEEVL